jgi:hypothetical protein
MAMRLMRSAVALMLLASGCYVEPAQESPEKRVDTVGHATKHPAVESPAGECRFGEGRGCFDAFLSSRRSLNVAGKTFFNADDLAARFGELVIKSATSEDPNDNDNDKVSTKTLRLDTPIDQGSFLAGFEFELNGATKRSGRVRPNGILSLHDLAPGSYDLRLSRVVRYTTVLTEEGQSRPESKSSCAILFADTPVEIQPGQRVWENISDFQVQIIGPTCGVGGV